MGSKMAPSYATLVLGYLENELYSQVSNKMGEEIGHYVYTNWRRFMPNVKSTIDAHNKRLLKQPNSREAISDANLCNCRKKEDCPLENQCLTKGIVYQATVTTEQGSECYVG